MIEDISHVCQIKVDDMILDLNFAHPNPFSAEPVTVLYLVDVSVDRPIMQTMI